MYGEFVGVSGGCYDAEWYVLVFFTSSFVCSSLMFVLRIGKSCGGNGLACASGVCTSLDSTWNIYTQGYMTDFDCSIRAMPDCGCFDELAESMP